MAQKPSFLKRITTASTVALAAAAIVGTGSTALGVDAPSGVLTSAVDPAVTSFADDTKWASILNDGTHAVGAVADVDGPQPNVATAITFGANGTTINVDGPNRIITAIDVNGKNAPVITATNSFTLGSVVSVAAGGNSLKITGVAGQTVTLTGTAANNAAHGFDAAANTYTALGKIDSANADFTVNVALANGAGTKAAPIVISATAANNNANGVLNITSGDFIQFNKATIANTKTINIADNQTLMFNVVDTVAGTLSLQTAAANTITFGATGNGTLALISKAGGEINANSFTVANGTLGGAVDNQGIIIFDTSAAAGQLQANAAGNTAVVGVDATHRAKSFRVKATDVNAATIKNNIFAANVELQGGVIIFEQIVNVGNAGTTAFTTAASQATISENSNLGAVTFGAFANNTLTLTNAAANTTLTGNFTGDATAANFPTMLFAGENTSALAAANAADPVVQNFKAIENTAAQAVTLGAGTYTTDLNISNVGGSFILADGFILAGNINQAKAVNALTSGTLTLQGNATISGNIGNGAEFGAINLANDATKTLTLGGASIIGVNGAARAINYQANGGTVKLTNTTVNNILVRYNLELAADTKGVFDASDLTNAQTLTISGSIGTFGAAVNGFKPVTKSLGQLSLAGSANLDLSANDAAINNLIMGDDTTVTLADHNYKIITANNPGQATVNITPTTKGANDLNSTYLVEGTSLGSVEAATGNISALKTIKFAGVADGATDVVLNVGKNVGLYATNITNTTNGIGSFSFTGGGTNIVSGQVGKATQMFNTVTLSNGTTAQYKNDTYFKGATTIGGGSTLQIGGNYTANRIVANGGGDTGTVEFTNNAPITVTLTKQAAAAANPLTALTVSGSGNVILNEIADPTNAANVATSLNFALINFGNNAVNSQLVLPTGTSLTDVQIASTAPNTVVNGVNTAPSVLVTGADSVIAAGQAIGDATHIVGIVLGSDNGITINNPNFYAGIDTVSNGTGTVTLSGGTAAAPGKVYALGRRATGNKLKVVNVTTNTQNFASTLANNLNIDDGVTFIAGNGTNLAIIDSAIQLGNNAGTGTLVITANTTLQPTASITAKVANKGNVTLQGSVAGLNAAIGKSGTPVALVEFTGTTPNPAVAEIGGYAAVLNQSIYSQNINFGKYAIIANIPEATLSGASAVNNIMALQSNQLTFTGGASTWGPNTSIHTTLANNTLGSIVISNGTVTAADNILTTVVIDDQDSLGATTQSYPLIKGGTNLTLANGKTVSLAETTLTSNQRFSAYSIIQDSNKDYLLQRENIAAKVIAGDLTANSRYSNIPGLAPNVAAILDINNTGDTSKFLTNIGNLNSADTAQAIVAVIAQDTNNLAVMQDIAADNISVLTNRVHGVRYLQGPAGAPEGVLARPEGGVVGAADDAEDNVSYGGWAKAIYSDATQKLKGGVAGYDAKTTGGIFGFDTMANDNLMIGAAIGVTKTDMKYKNYRAGDKSTINGFSFSLYGAQQLVDNFFFQGATTFSTNQVKGKSKRYMANATGQKVTETASASYDNLTYAAEGMFGYDAKVMENVLLTPMAGIRYIKSSDESYKETGTTFQNKSVAGKFSDKTDVIVGARVIGDSMNLSQFMFYPEAHAFVTHKVSGKLAKIQSSLDGQVTPFIGQPDKTDKTSYNLGLSVTARPGPQMEYGIGYDANLVSKYVAHTGTLKVRVNF